MLATYHNAAKATMVAVSKGFVALLILLMTYVGLSTSAITYYIPYQTPLDCIRSSRGAATSQYFDVNQLACVPCSQPAAFQRTSTDGLSCECTDNYRIVSIDRGSLTCAACPDGQVASFSGWECVTCRVFSSATTLSSVCPKCSSSGREISDGWDCVKCSLTASNAAAYANSSDDSLCPACAVDSISVERLLNGAWASPAYTRTCQQCADNTWPDAAGTRCVRCNQILSVGNQTSCTCPDSQKAGGLCFRSPNDLITTTQQLFSVTFGTQTFSSQYMADNLQAAAAMCQPSYGNQTACQLLANLCVLSLYSQGSSNAPTACTLYLRGGSINGATISTNWPTNLPWLYYFGQTTTFVLSDKSITTQYTFPNSRLNLTVSAFTLNGTFVGYQSVLGGLLQLCKNSDDYLDAAYVFGTTYKQSCSIDVRDFWDTSLYQTVFYDPWLQYTLNGVNELYAVPVLVENYVDTSGKTVNEALNDYSQFVRRFFLVDNISGRQAATASGGSAGRLTAVRYAKSIILKVQLQPDQSDGLITPPYFVINYETATLDDYNSNKKVQVSFEVLYSMPLTSFETSLSIAVGVLSGLGVLYAGLQTWAWSRRAGRIGIDFVAIIKFVAFACGSVANAFFVSLLGSSLWWLIFYKKQTNVYLLVHDGTTAQFVGFMVTALLLKLIQLIHVIVCQVTVDIFLIDWERPMGKVVPVMTKEKDNEPASEIPVSIWRTYFIANEWNEIQVERRISPMFQYFATVLFLYVIGVGNVATMDSQSSLDISSSKGQYFAPMSSVLRFAMIGIVYLLIALAQWIFFTFIYERFFEHKLHQFCDLCSISNISVCILENYQFGYYIHGRSVHGRADVGLREMHENFIREEKNLVSKRGLLPDSEQQTFDISLQRKLRLDYDRILQPVLLQEAGGAARAAVRSDRVAGGVGQNNRTHLDAATETSVIAYNRLNSMLQLYIDHCLTDVDYVPKPKLLFENLLNAEFQEPVDKGYFYTDVGLSFAAVLFYGHEITLLIFELLFFAVIDLGAASYVLDAIILYILMEGIVKGIRSGLGRNNLAKKTLVDKRFLI